jgi:hypothetical protein
VVAAARAAPALAQLEQAAPLAIHLARGVVPAATALPNPPAAKAVRLEIRLLSLPGLRVRTASIPRGRELGQGTSVPALKFERPNGMSGAGGLPGHGFANASSHGRRRCSTDRPLPVEATSASRRDLAEHAIVAGVEGLAAFASTGEQQ